MSRAALVSEASLSAYAPSDSNAIMLEDWKHGINLMKTMGRLDKAGVKDNMTVVALGRQMGFDDSRIRKAVELLRRNGYQ